MNKKIVILLPMLIGFFYLLFFILNKKNDSKTKKECYHGITKKMTWPDNGISELCTKCLMTRYHTKFHTTEWQDNGYRDKADWYMEHIHMEEEAFAKSLDEKCTKLEEEHETV